jgi:hypothetical protein
MLTGAEMLPLIVGQIAKSDSAEPEDAEIIEDDPADTTGSKSLDEADGAQVSGSTANADGPPADYDIDGDNDLTSSEKKDAT